MSKLFEFQSLDEFVVPCYVHKELVFIQTREPHKVSSKLLPKWCLGVVIHRPTHIKEPDTWVVSDIVTHLNIPIKVSKQMKEAVMRAAATLKSKGEDQYEKGIEWAASNFSEFVGDPLSGYNLLNSK